MLPSFPFDIRQGENVRKPQEIVAIYETIIVSKFFNDEFDVAIKCILNNEYNFDLLKPHNNDGRCFTDLLEDLQNLQSLFITNILSACQTEISRT